jgi:hypothetical protein
MAPDGPNNEVRLEDFDSSGASSFKSAPPKPEKRCKRLSSDTTKQQRQEAHQVKMVLKSLRRKGYGPTGKGLPVRENRSRKWEVTEVVETNV